VKGNKMPKTIQTKIIVFLPDGKIYEREEVLDDPESNGPGTWLQLHKIIDPILQALRPQARFEHVNVLYKGERRDMFVDEAGVQYGLPVNAEATDIYWAARLRREPKASTRGWPRIHGAAVLFPDRRIWF